MSEKTNETTHETERGADKTGRDPSSKSPEADRFTPFDDDELDEDLMALSPPPPSARFLVFTSMVLILSVVMLGWFLPDLRFLMTQLSGPKALGEAADIDMRTLQNDQYVTLMGFPLVQRTLTFKEGVKWFMMSDNMRKFFPLAGQPNLYVQWEESDAHKAYRDPDNNPGVLGPPSSFKGHLLSREALGKSYQQVFVFYDCLKYHYLGRCNRCLGKATMTACRDAFVCAENNDPAVCDTLRTRSDESIREELDALKTAGGKSTQIQSLEMLRSAKREQRIAVQSVRLEELSMRAAQLEQTAATREDPMLASLEKTRHAIIALQMAELEIRAGNALKTVASLSEAKRREIREAVALIERKQQEKAALTQSLRTMRIFIQVGDELSRLKSRAQALKEKAVLLPKETLHALFDFDPNTPDGNALMSALSALESAVAPLERALYMAQPDAGANDTHADAGASAAATPRVALPAVSPALKANPDYQKLLANLDGVKDRADHLLRKLKVLMPGQIKAFDAWAEKPDVLGSIPEGLREARVVGAIHDIEKMLKDAPSETPGEAPLLAEAYNAKIDALSEVTKQIAALEKTPGLKELLLTEKLSTLTAASRKSADVDDPQTFERDMEQLLAELVESGLYLHNLKGAPEAMTALEKVLVKERLDAFASTLDDAAASLSPGDWVLIDGEIPLDKLWVIAVYLVLLSMIVLNIRKLWRFYLAYKA